MKFKREVLQTIVCDDCINAEKIEDTIMHCSRWSIHRAMIFRYENKFYRSTYSVGATEYQGEKPYECSNGEVECPEVELKEVKVKKWVIKE